MADEATPLVVRLSVDADRDGVIEQDNPRRHSWTWGPDGAGAIVAVDRDRDAFNPADACPIVLTVEGLPEHLAVHLSMDTNAMFNATITSSRGEAAQTPVLGAGVPPQSRREISPPFSNGVHDIYLFAHFLPDGAFDGLIQIYAEILDTAGGRARHAPADAILVRVAPWIMPSHLDPPEQLYVSTIGPYPEEPQFDNVELIRALRDVTGEQGLAPLVEFKSNDIWVQDEIEFGYSVVPSDDVRHVCVDGPRNRDLDNHIENVVATDEISVYPIDVQREYRNSLDSFGNLEVSPPVPGHPLGRIILGTKLPLEKRGRQTQLELRKFLNYQLVQELLQVYTDWLAVGHVDEMLCIEPDPQATHGFRILTASPRAFRARLEELADAGHGSAVLWEGRTRLVRDPDRPDVGPRPVAADETIEQLLAKTALWVYNEGIDAILDGIRADLSVGLSVPTHDIYEMPVAFRHVDDVDGDGIVDAKHPDEFDRAIAYFPDMVNHLVIGPTSIVPRPYGPCIDGVDQLEAMFIDIAGPSRDVRFVDDWLAYHENMGEVHCGTNTRRRPSQPPRWWELEPQRAMDLSFRRSRSM